LHDSFIALLINCLFRMVFLAEWSQTLIKCRVKIFVAIMVILSLTQDGVMWALIW
jgi:hypothetical protein